MAPSTLPVNHAALVFAGGAVGTLLRALILNVIGAFALGALNGALAHRAESAGVRRIRLLLGTGVLGGFTTYSAFAVMVAADPTGWTLASAVLTVVLGTAAAWGGLALARGFSGGSRSGS